jgi:hypothetical protein
MIERRKHRRIEISQAVTLLRRDGSLVADCMLQNISVGGARLHFEVIPDIPQELSLRMPRGGKVHRHCEVVWLSSTDIGVRFVADGPDLANVSHAVEYL